MGISELFAGLFGKKKGDGTWFLTDKIALEAAEASFKNLAVQSCVSLIANAIAQCEFSTYEKGVPSRGLIYYLLNVRPNQNQNAGEFISAVVSKLVYNNECLIVMINDMLYVAESFSVKPFALYDNLYSQVQIGDFTMTDRIFSEREVCHFRLHDKPIKQVVDSLYVTYGQLLKSAESIYKRRNAKRVALKTDINHAAVSEEQQKVVELLQENFKPWLETDSAGAVMPLFKGYELQDVSDAATAGNANTSRDIRALADDFIDMTAMAFHLPAGVLKGQMADIQNQLDSFLMFCVKPIAELIADEINGKMYTREEYLARTYLRIDTSQIKLVDIGTFAIAADKLFSVGAYSTNDILRQMGREPVPESWADDRHVTKNYEKMKGGEKDARAGN